jgi:hypothetical protein
MLVLKKLVLVCFAALLLCAAGCGGGSDSVAPEGATYSYEVPDGFEQVDASFPGGGAKFLTTVVPEGTSGEGLLSAFEMNLNAAQQAYPTPRMLVWLEQVTQRFYKGQGATLSAGAKRTVAGQPSICWQIHGFDNPSEGLVDADSCAIVGSGGVVQQACLWKPATKERIQSGCEALRESLEVS